MTHNLKSIAMALSALILMQSCSVYHSKTATIDEAVAANSKVKIYTTDNQKYKFDKLIKEESKIYGFKKINTSNRSATKSRIELASNIKEIDVNTGLAKILIPFDIEEIHTKNKTLSTIISIGIPVVIIIGLIGAAYGAAASVAFGY